MNRILSTLSHSTQRYIAAFSLLFLFAACNQTPTPNNPDPNNITGMQVENENGTLSLAAATTQGLTGDYFDNMDFTGTKKTQIDATINKTWNNNSPVTGIAKTTYSVRWTGQIQPQYTQKYTFYVTSSDGARLMVNGQALVNDWKDGVNRVRSGTVDLIANTKYDIRLEYYRNATNAGAVKLEWQSTSRTRQVVPQVKLYPTGSNSTIAFNLVTQNAKFQALNLVVNQTEVFAVLGSDGTISVNMPEKNGLGFAIAAIKQNVVQQLFYISRLNDVGVFKNVLKNKSVEIPNLSQFRNADGSYTLSQLQSVANLLVEVVSEGAIKKQLSNAQTTSIKPQWAESIPNACNWIPPPPSCTNGNCSIIADAYREAVCGVLYGTGEFLLGQAAGAILTGGWANVAFYRWVSTTRCAFETHFIRIVMGKVYSMYLW